MNEFGTPGMELKECSVRGVLFWRGYPLGNFLSEIVKKTLSFRINKL